MHSLALTGPTGVGKSTVQHLLIVASNAWTPLNYVTRHTTGNERYTCHIDEQDFREKVARNELVAPQQFGGQWYAWSKEDVARLKDPSTPAVLNVRPYTALLLHALLPQIHPVWLFESAVEVGRRRMSRSEPRDLGGYNQQRLTDEDLEAQYEELFTTRVRADDRAVEILIALLGELNGDK